jgi:hypothetical protein
LSFRVQKVVFEWEQWEETLNASLGVNENWKRKWPACAVSRSFLLWETLNASLGVNENWKRKWPACAVSRS